MAIAGDHAGDGSGAALLADRCTEQLQSEFRVVTRRRRLGHRRFTVSVQTREKYCRLYLRAGHGHLILNGAQSTTVNLEGWKIVVAAVYGCTHFAQRRDHALHRPFL